MGVPLLLLLGIGGYGLNSMDDDWTGGAVKRWIGNTVKGWADDKREVPKTLLEQRSPKIVREPRSELNREFSERGGSDDKTGTTQEQLKSSTSDLSLKGQLSQAAAPVKQETEEAKGDGLIETVMKLATGKEDYGKADDFGFATAFAGASKLAGVGNMKTAVLTALATVLWNFRAEIIGGFKTAFGMASNMTGLSNPQALERPPFEALQIQLDERNRQAKEGQALSFKNPEPGTA
ncbi:MAG: hypothetical protein OEY94_03205 [Alphaproteobacteria bacterium]|nr:hypothetical protein [Alphaproteobacteria bacterium]